MVDISVSGRKKLSVEAGVACATAQNMRAH